MNNDSKILKALGDLKDGQKVLQADVTSLKSGQNTLQSDVSVLKSDVSVLKSDVSVLKSDVSVLKSDVSVLKDVSAHTNTAIKTLATKQDVEITVNQAKGELKEDILMLDAKVSKVVKKVQAHERRISNIEEHESIDNPDKN